MKDFENELDEIRVKLYEESKYQKKEDIIKNVNSNCRKIAYEFDIIVKSNIQEKQLYIVNV